MVRCVVPSQGGDGFDKHNTSFLFQVTNCTEGLFNNQLLSFDLCVFDKLVKFVGILFRFVIVQQILRCVKLRLEVDALREEIVVRI